MLSHEEFLKWINYEKDYSVLCHNCEKVLDDWGEEIHAIRFCSQHCHAEWQDHLQLMKHLKRRNRNV